MERRFVRKTGDRVFGGVCSGLADYVNMDRSMVRLIALVGIVLSGMLPGILLYILCVIIVPSDAQYSGGYSEEEDAPVNNGGNNRFVVGFILIGFGIFLLARMFFNWLDWRYVFAGLMILGGIYLLSQNRRGN